MLLLIGAWDGSWGWFERCWVGDVTEDMEVTEVAVDVERTLARAEADDRELAVDIERRKPASEEPYLAGALTKLLSSPPSSLAGHG